MIRAWCELQLDDAGATRHDLDTSVGRTRVTKVGSGPDIVLLPGTNFSTATGLRLLALVGANTARSVWICQGSQGSRRGNVHAIATPTESGSARLFTRSGSTGVVMGHSLGGRAALLGAQGDASVKGLVLVASGGLIRVRPALLPKTIRWLVRRDEASSAALLRGMAAPGADLPARLATWLALVARHVRTSLAPPALPRAALAEIRCPVWLVTGRHDRFLPPNASSRRRRGSAARPRRRLSRRRAICCPTRRRTRYCVPCRSRPVMRTSVV